MLIQLLMLLAGAAISQTATVVAALFAERRQRTTTVRKDLAEAYAGWAIAMGEAIPAQRSLYLTMDLAARALPTATDTTARAEIIAQGQSLVPTTSDAVRKLRAATMRLVLLETDASFRSVINRLTERAVGPRDAEGLEGAALHAALARYPQELATVADEFRAFVNRVADASRLSR